MIKRKKAKCPHCETLHEYSEVKFSMVNDSGYWKVQCSKCDESFGIRVLNPSESSMERNYLVVERHEDTLDAELSFATDIVEYNIDLNKTSHEFDYTAATLYLCDTSGCDLEQLAKQSLNTSFKNLKEQYGVALNYCLSNRTPDYEFFVARLPVSCLCGSSHTAIFYTSFLTNGHVPQRPEEFLLADVDGVALSSGLTGIFTKTEIMAFLEKLIIRWNLKASTIVIASPFVGHQYLSKEDKLSIWSWLLSQLDHRKAIFVTRTNTLNSYKSLLCDQEGMNYEMLKEYDLENRVVSANTKKNDFHAKFFAGVADTSAEVLSGSANLVKGPSMENCSFHVDSRDRFEQRYWSRLNVKNRLHAVQKRHWIECSNLNGNWCAVPKSGTEI
ncbi:hypothetical protein [Aliidiomarina quisquiliarum]|uniref:hypothetical protein n=1 Tax=Aliidiomarina quisquiliarum TaxID=2938947 RepID=UPI00208F5641|nr:hypothetical protein [Aliidiomarina quisquiliarum]MCO4322358.1 hypothetical protein [Aliidiomarina quisquiliarum]